MFTQRLGIGVLVSVMSMTALPVWAATTTATSSVTASIPARAELTVTRDTNSVTRGSASDIVFDRYDDQDGQPDGNANFMYAPYRSETGKNWHIAKIVSNGSTMTLSADVSGTIGGAPAASVLEVFFGGLFHSNGSDKGGKSGDWENLDTFTRTLNESFNGVGPFNYRLKASDVSSGSYAAQITYTLTSS